MRIAAGILLFASTAVAEPEPEREPELHIGPVETVDLPFDRSQLTLSLRGTTPGKLDDGGGYRDGAIAIGGAISLYSRLAMEQGRPTSALRVMAQFRIEGERVTSDLFATDPQIVKASLGVSAVYVAPSLNLYALYAGAAIAETRATLPSPSPMPTVIGLGSYRQSEQLTWIYGGGFGYAAGRGWLLPAAGVMWTMGEGWTLTTILPIFVDVRHAFTEHLSAHVIASVSGDRFSFANDGQFAGAGDTLLLRLGQGKLGAGVSYRFGDHWSVRGEVGVVGPRRLTIVDDDTTLTTSTGKGAGYLSTGVTYAFGNAPL